jgi:chromosome segregation ATPase
VQGKAETEIRAYQEEADTKLVTVQQELNRYKSQEKQWQAMQYELEERCHQQIAQNKQLNSEFIAEQQINAKLTSRIESLQAAKDEANKENDRLHKLLQHIQQNLEHYQTAAQKLREEQTILLEKQRAEYEQRVVDLQNRVEKNIQDKLYCQAQYEQLQKSFDGLDAKYQHISEQYNALQQQHSSLEAKYDKLDVDNRGLKAKWQIQKQGIDEKQNIIRELQLKLNLSDDRLIATEKALSSVEDKIGKLRDNFLFSMQENANLKGQLQQIKNSHEKATT